MSFETYILIASAALPVVSGIYTLWSNHMARINTIERNLNTRLTSEEAQKLIAYETKPLQEKIIDIKEQVSDLQDSINNLISLIASK
jgi:hypothetical protein